LKCLCNLARYWLQASWGWHDSVETCRGSVIICEIIVHLVVIVQNIKLMCFQFYVHFLGWPRTPGPPRVFTAVFALFILYIKRLFKSASFYTISYIFTVLLAPSSSKLSAVSFICCVQFTFRFLQKCAQIFQFYNFGSATYFPDTLLCFGLCPWSDFNKARGFGSWSPKRRASLKLRWSTNSTNKKYHVSLSYGTVKT
jgi:hypothetical protein